MVITKQKITIAMLVLLVVGLLAIPVFATDMVTANKIYYYDLHNAKTDLVTGLTTLDIVLENGSYHVTVTTSHVSPEADLIIEAEGTTCFYAPVDSVQSSVEESFEVDVTDGELNLVLSGFGKEGTQIEISQILKFDFGNISAAKGYVQVPADLKFDPAIGYGFATPGANKIQPRTNWSTQDPLLNDAVRFVEDGRLSSNSFDIVLAPGRYKFSYAAGQISRMSLYVNGLPGTLNITGSNSREEFEMNIPEGLAKITLTGKAGTAFELACLQVKKIADAVTVKPTIWIGGDSTVCNYYPLEPNNKGYNTGWGQVLPFFVTNDFIIRNYATSGQTTQWFRADGAFDGIVAQIKPGEYFLVQLGINDRNKISNTEYRANLEYFVEQIRAQGGIPILMTPQGRADGFKAEPSGSLSHGVSGWAGLYDLVRIVAREKNVLLIDNANLSSAYYVSIGEEATRALYADNTHPNYFGALQLARIVTEEIKRQEDIAIETTSQKENYASSGAMQLYTPEFKNLAGEVQTELTSNEQLIVSLLAKNNGASAQVLTLVSELVNAEQVVEAKTRNTYQVDGLDRKALEAVITLPQDVEGYSIRLSVVNGDQDSTDLITNSSFTFTGIPEIEDEPEVITTELVSEGNLDDQIAAGDLAAVKLILPSGDVEGFEYENLPLKTQVDQQADPNFDGWAMLGSNATRSASLELDVRGRTRYIKVYSELGMRSDGVTKGSTVFSRDLNASGVLMIEFSVKFYDGVGNVSLKNTGATSWGAGHTAISIGASGRNLTATNGTGEEVLLSNYSEFKWYRFVVITNTDTRKYSVQVYDGDKIVGELLFLDYAISNDVQASGIRNINVFLPDQSVDKQIWIDNVKVYHPAVANIKIRAAGNGLQIPQTGTKSLELVAGAYDPNGLLIPGYSFDWGIVESTPGVSLAAVADRPDSILLVADANAVAKPITVTATTSGLTQRIEVPLTSSDMGIELVGPSSILIPFTESESTQFSALVRTKLGEIANEKVTWYLYDADNLVLADHLGIELNSATGELVVQDSTQPQIFTLRAVLHSDSIVSASKKIVVHSLKYDFGSEQVDVGYTKITPETLYNLELGYGINPNTPVKAHVNDENDALYGDYVYADSYFVFQQNLPAGNYRVKAWFVDAQPNNMIIGVENVPTQAFRSTQFYDNRLVKGNISFNGSSELEFDVAVIDGVLDLEIFGNLINGNQFKAMLTALEITKLPPAAKTDRPTVHLIGDSTVQGYSTGDVMAGWGQKIGSFLGNGYLVNNGGIGGRSSASFYREGRLERILFDLKPGDIVLIQLGHNDGTYNKAERYTANSDYEKLYTEYYIPGVKQRGGIPVIITSVPMHGFSSTSGLGSYVNSAKRVAQATDTLIIDAHNLALGHYNSLPGNQSEKQTVLDSYYVLNKKGGNDYTHFTKDGARKMAELIYNGLVELEVVK